MCAYIYIYIYVYTCTYRYYVYSPRFAVTPCNMTPPFPVQKTLYLVASEKTLPENLQLVYLIPVQKILRVARHL